MKILQPGQIAANAIGHAVLGGVIAELSGGNATAGAVGAAAGELAARAIKDYLYPDTATADLADSDKSKISNPHRWRQCWQAA